MKNEYKPIEKSEIYSHNYIKNFGWEVLATTLEAICIPLLIGGIRVNCDNIRNKKIYEIMEKQ